MPQAWNFIKKETVAQVFSYIFCEISKNIKKETVAQVFSYIFCEISKNTFSYRTPPVAASFNKNRFLIISEILPIIEVVYGFMCFV